MRPYPAPQQPHAISMTWSKLLFAHWPVAPNAIQALLPPGLEVETFEGQAYFALVPFEMSRVRTRGLPPVPGTHTFLEMNLRTYARHPVTGKTGVWFFSLDSNSLLSNWVARNSFHLRYLLSEMSLLSEGNQMVYRSKRIQREGIYHPFPATYGPAVEVHATYQPTGPSSLAVPLIEFLTNRYRLFSYSRKGRLYAAEIDHAPWPLQAAEADFEHLDITQQLGFELAGDPILLYSEQLKVVGWRPYRLPTKPLYKSSG